MVRADKPRLRAAVVVTGSELVRGDRGDANGPFFARSLSSLGIEPSRITVVGDSPDELESALREGLEHDLLVVSGGLGPTHDDRTVELLARAAGLGLETDAELERRIDERSRATAERLRRPYADFAAGVSKQATVPDGAVVVGLAGTAPALVLRAGSCVVVLLPGPPGELQALWPHALETDEVRAVLARARARTRRELRFFGVSESAVAQALADAGGDGNGVEATICAHDLEIHVDLVVEPGAGEKAEELLDRLAGPLEAFLYARDDAAPVEEIVLRLCRNRELTLASAESCTGGMVAERLTSVPGSSDVFVGAIIAYADTVKTGELGVTAEVLREHGAVSAETAAAMAHGVRERLGADIGVAVTGIAGPGGGTAGKPVGLVYVHAAGPNGVLSVEFSYGGDRESVRRRATAAALHLVRKLVTEL
jgi:competence/damage-inducible protein CinA-like protein